MGADHIELMCVLVALLGAAAEAAVEDETRRKREARERLSQQRRDTGECGDRDKEMRLFVFVLR